MYLFDILNQKILISKLEELRINSEARLSTLEMGFPREHIWVLLTVHVNIMGDVELKGRSFQLLYIADELRSA
jgi:hypothetical protein